MLKMIKVHIKSFKSKQTLQQSQGPQMMNKLLLHKSEHDK